MAARGNAFESVLDYCEKFTFKQAPLSPLAAAELFASISCDARMEFFEGWLLKQGPGSYLAYDSASYSTYPDVLGEMEHGRKKDAVKLARINFSCYYSQNTQLPVFYATCPGSITDKAQLPRMMAHNAGLGVKDVVLVMDREYCTADNVKHMAEAGFDFITGVDPFHETCREIIAAWGGLSQNLFSLGCHVEGSVFARSTNASSFGASTTMQVFYDAHKGQFERASLKRIIDLKKEAQNGRLKLTKGKAASYREFFIIDLADD